MNNSASPYKRHRFPSEIIQYARRLRRRHQGYGDTFFIDEVFVKIQGEQHYLWRAINQDSEVVDVFIQACRDGKAAKHFFKRLLRTNRVALGAA